MSIALEDETSAYLEYEPEISTVKKAYRRIVVVSPYAQLALFLKEEIPKIVDGSLIDRVVGAETKEHPYINVEKREAKHDKPFWIVDFGKILAPAPSYNALLEQRIKVLGDNIKSLISHDEILKKTILHYPITLEYATRLVRDISHYLEDFFAEHLFELWRFSDDTITYDDSVRRDVLFNGYREWAQMNKLTLLTPTRDFTKSLEDKSLYDENGNLVLDQYLLTEFHQNIVNDLINFYSGKYNLELFAANTNK